MKTVLVTGASGFVGGHVVEVLARGGVRPRCLVRKASRLDFIKEWSPEFVFGDITSPSSLESAVEGVDGIIHCAGVTRALSLKNYMQVNAGGCENLYRACLARNPGVRRIVHVSSLAALGPSVAGRPVQEGQDRRPVSDYGRSKLAGHRIAEAHMDRLPITIIVPPAVYGPFDRDFLRYFAGVKRGFALMIGREERWISLIYAKDLARAVLACLDSEKASGNEYIVEDGRPHAWTELAAAIGRSLHKSPVLLRLPPFLAKVACAVTGFVAKCTGKPALFSRDKLKEILQPSWTCSSAKIRADLGFSPQYSLEKGIEETYRWYTEHKWL
jgi:nucleoside-diphosphate-sugar epimerase